VNVSEYVTRSGHRVRVELDPDAAQVVVTAWPDASGRTPARSTLRELAARHLPAPPILMCPWVPWECDGRACVRGSYA
jgi:hypothetical protein